MKTYNTHIINQCFKRCLTVGLPALLLVSLASTNGQTAITVRAKNTHSAAPGSSAALGSAPALANGKIAGLLVLANRGLAGVSTGGASLTDINATVQTINSGFDRGRRLVSCSGASAGIDASNRVAWVAHVSASAALQEPGKAYWESLRRRVLPKSHAGDLRSWLRI